MKQMKWISLLLALVMGLCLLTGCSEQEPEEITESEPVVMPYGLTFGMTYIEAREQHADIPSSEYAETNDGYFAGVEWVSSDDFCEFYGIDGYVGSPGYGYSFNEQKELYEFYAMGEIASENDAEQAFNAVMDYYNEELDQEAEIYESDTELMAQWETDDYSHYVSLTMENDSFSLMIVLHSFEYGLTD